MHHLSYVPPPSAQTQNELNHTKKVKILNIFKVYLSVLKHLYVFFIQALQTVKISVRLQGSN